MAAKRKKTSLIARIFRLLCVLTLAIVCISTMAAWRLQNWAQTPMTLVEHRNLDFRRGTSLIDLAHQLESRGLIDQPQFFHLWVRFFSSYSKFQAGLYRFHHKISPQDIANQLIAGKIYEPVVLSYTIPEGFTYKQIAARLIARGVGSQKQFDSMFRSRRLLSKWNIPSDSLEGYFYPATYSFVKKIGAEEALRQGVKVFWEKLPRNYQRKVQQKGLSLQQAVIFASLIELETKHEDEKPKVAEVIWRRLDNREPLAIDAALIYGIRDYRGDIKWSHLKDKKNPYNTRIHAGLPPTPIASPDVSSLTAVLKPTNQGYYYYVLDVNTRDRHHFSKTLAEHNRYVQKLISATKGKRRHKQNRER